MSSNLTIEEGLLKQHTAEPLEGHNVVVFEKVGFAGEKVHSVLPPGAPRARVGLVRAVLGKTDPFFAYAVDASPSRLLSFCEHVVLTDHGHEFDLLFGLSYGVSDPRLLACERNKDPLRRIRDHAAWIVGSAIRLLPWDEVRFSFARAGEAVVQRELARLDHFASSFGVEVLSLGLEARLSELDVELAKEHAAGARKQESHQIDAGVKLAEVTAEEQVAHARTASAFRLNEHELSLQLQGASLRQAAAAAQGTARTQNAVLNALTGAIERVGGTISTPQELLEAMGVVRGLANGAYGGPGGDGGNGYGVPAPVQGGMLGNGHGGDGPALPGAAAGPLSAVLGEVVTATDVVRIRPQKQALRAALLHLVAHAVAEDSGDAAAEARHALRARTLIDALDPPPPAAALEALRRLADVELLRGRFDN